MTPYLKDADVTGLCECGCGRPAPIAKKTDRRRGAYKGHPRRFILGHNKSWNGRIYPLYLREDRGYKTPCWIWQGKPNGQGYGQVVRGEERGLAHRVMFRRAGHDLPKGVPLHHRCRIRLCVNPNHLEITTNVENARQGAGTKITAEIAAYIRRSTDTRSSLAMRFGVTETHIYRIRRGDSWA